MADTDITNVTPLRHKDAKRIKATARKRRQRQKQPVTLPVTRDVPPVTPIPVGTSPHRRVASLSESLSLARGPAFRSHSTESDAVIFATLHRGVTVVTLLAALALATVSGFFSIVGMTSIFAGAPVAVIGMGVALEAGKLSAVAWLGHHHHGTASRLLWAALVALVAVLMALNAIGANGFLAKAHIGHALAGDLAVAGRAAEADSRLSVQAGVVADIDRRIAQIDTAVEKATERGRTAGAMKLADEQRKVRAELAASRVREGKALAVLQVEKATVDGERRTVEADLGADALPRDAA
jgi:hypothetical protein